jgi:hypothetical protein
MFDHFTFGAPSRFEEQSTTFSISPCDTSFPSPLTPVSPTFTNDELAAPSAFTDLVTKLEGQDLQQEDDISTSYLYSLPSPPSDCDDGMYFGSSQKVIRRRENNFSQSPSICSARSSSLRCRRLQRQINTQLLCTRSQVSSIGALVEEMVSNGEQCTVTPAPLNVTSSIHISPPTASSSSTYLLHASQPIEEESTSNEAPTPDDIDEGFFEADADDQSHIGIDVQSLLMSIRRADGNIGGRMYSPARMRHQGDAVSKARIKRRISKRRHDE